MKRDLGVKETLKLIIIKTNNTNTFYFRVRGGDHLMDFHLSRVSWNLTPAKGEGRLYMHVYMYMCVCDEVGTSVVIRH